MFQSEKYTESTIHMFVWLRIVVAFQCEFVSANKIIFSTVVEIENFYNTISEVEEEQKTFI